MHETNEFRWGVHVTIVCILFGILFDLHLELLFKHAFDLSSAISRLWLGLILLFLNLLFDAFFDCSYLVSTPLVFQGMRQ